MQSSSVHTNTLEPFFMFSPFFFISHFPCETISKLGHVQPRDGSPSPKDCNLTYRQLKTQVIQSKDEVSMTSTLMLHINLNLCMRAHAVEMRRRVVQRNSSRRLGLGARALAVVSRGDEVTVSKPKRGVFCKNMKIETD